MESGGPVEDNCGRTREWRRTRRRCYVWYRAGSGAGLRLYGEIRSPFRAIGITNKVQERSFIDQHIGARYDVFSGEVLHLRFHRTTGCDDHKSSEHEGDITVFHGALLLPRGDRCQEHISPPARHRGRAESSVRISWNMPCYKAWRVRVYE